MKKNGSGRSNVDDAGVLESWFSPSIARRFRSIPWPRQSIQPPPPHSDGGGGEEEASTNSSLGDNNEKPSFDDYNQDELVDSCNEIPSIVLNPTPLRCYCPQESNSNGPDSSTSESDHDQNTPLGNTTTTVKKSRERGKRKISNSDGSGQSQSRKRRSKSNGGDDSSQRPSVPFEEVPLLQQTLISRKGSRPVFLYRKILERSDILRDQNRLFVNEKEKLMKFLTDEEVAAVVGDGKGLKAVGIDGVGKVYKTVGVKKWLSLGKIAINADWSQLVAANKARKGDVVEMWGYREKGKACLGFNFLKERENVGDETRLRALAEAAIRFDEERRKSERRFS